MSTPVEISFFGGLGEIGANMAAIEVDGRIALIDVGLIFPDADHYGIDLILPDWTVLRERPDDLECIILTHGHEDHIGAVPFLLREFGSRPIYASKLTLGLLRAKLEEHPDVEAELVEVEAGERIKSDPFDVEFVAMNHSIPDGLAVAVHTPHGTVLHSGDFKLDQMPIDGRPTDLPHLAALGDDGVALLLADSTNAEVSGLIPSERVVGHTMQETFDESTGRIIVTTFASHIHRVQQVLHATVEAGRKACFVGRSMVRNTQIARELGYLEYRDEDIIELDEVDGLRRDEVVIICTGSQGEPFAALSLMAVGQHRQVEIEEGDTVVMASSVIPGNEHAIYRAINNLFRRGARVVHKGVAPIHVSGHASADELRLVHNIIRPTAVVPVHGEYRHLVAHAEIARQTGADPDQVLVCSDGDRVILEDGRIRRGESFTAGRVFVDGLGVGDVGNAVLRDRHRLSNEGICVASLVIDSRGRLVGEPEVTQSGIIYEPERADLLARAAQVLREELSGRGHEGDPSVLRRLTVQTLARFWRDEVGRRPVIHPLIVEV
ncbi:MAG TPA: ribonuclease J, partial [Euzebyales bacterium]|nr:ribonuclease J [Euzebyales bacterium]